MNKFPNKNGISVIEIKKNLVFYCPIGKDYYSGEIEIRIWPDAVLVDFIEIEKYFQGIDGKSFIIEEAVANIFEYFTDQYVPEKLEVQIRAISNVHFPVIVTKRSRVMNE